MSAFQIYLPEVDPLPETVLERVFANARKVALQGPKRGVVLITPGRFSTLLPCPPPGSQPAERVADIERIVPGPVPQNITVIAFNDIARQPRDVFHFAAQTIPFFGYLLGMAYIGHAVTIFEGSTSALTIGCRDADVIIIDEGMARLLPDGGKELISQITPSRRMLIFGQDGKLSLLARKS